MPQTNVKTDVTLAIQSLSYGPNGIGRAEGKVVMIPHTAPGDVVRARIVEEKKRHTLAQAVEIIEASPIRRQPRCPYSQDCGGCTWQHIAYETQLAAKQKNVDDALRRIGKFDDFELRPIVPSVREFHYRRRIRLQCNENKQIGYFRNASHDLVEITACDVADETLDRLLIEQLRRWIAAIPVAPEHVELVSGDDAGERVALISNATSLYDLDESSLRPLLAEGTGLAGVVAKQGHDRLALGNSTITVKLQAGLAVKVDADVFTQVNAASNQRMVAALLALADFRADDRILELYSGMGNFTFPMARQVQRVVAVESHALSLANAQRNAAALGFTNIEWLHARAATGITRLRKRKERFSAIVLDPPRAGAKEVVEELAGFGAGRILYISCNPTTLARDLALLREHGYRLKSVQPMDFFPQSFHVESLAVLTR